MPFVIYERECQHENSCKEPNCSCPFTLSALVRHEENLERVLEDSPGAIVEEWDFVDDDEFDEDYEDEDE